MPNYKYAEESELDDLTPPDDSSINSLPAAPAGKTYKKLDEMMKDLSGVLGDIPAKPGKSPSKPSGTSDIGPVPIEFREYFEGIDTPADMPLTPAQEDVLEDAPTTFQSPIKGDWKNLGDFSPNVATDVRHPKGHDGIDMRSPEGTPIYPMAPGIVIKTDSTPKGGNTLTIEHADNIKTYYAHCAEVKVQKGQKVDNNTIIATVGTSGNAQGTYPHLHFQVWRNGQLQNPANFFTVPKYSKLEKHEKRYISPEYEAAMKGRAKRSSQIEKLYKIATIYSKSVKF